MGRLYPHEATREGREEGREEETGVAMAERVRQQGGRFRSRRKKPAVED
jgi:hypothetical protein